MRFEDILHAIARIERYTAGMTYEALVRQLQHLNPGAVDHRLAEDALARLIRLQPSIEGSLQAWEYLRGLTTVFAGFSTSREQSVPAAGCRIGRRGRRAALNGVRSLYSPHEAFSR